MIIVIGNKSSGINFIGKFEDEVKEKIKTDLYNNEPTRTHFEQGGTIDLEKKKIDNCSEERNCEYISVKYYTNPYGDWVPASLKEDEEGYEITILL